MPVWVQSLFGQCPNRGAANRNGASLTFWSELWNVSAFAQCLVGAFRYTPSDGCLCSLLVGAEGSHSRSWCREPVFTKRGCISIMSHLNWNFLWHLLQGANFTQMIRQLAAVQPVLWLGGGNALFVIWKKCCGTWIHNDLDNQWLDTRQILCRCLRSRSCSGHWGSEYKYEYKVLSF